MNEITELKNDIIQKMTGVEFYPVEIKEEDANLANTMKLPLAQISSLGVAFQPITTAFQKILGGSKSVSQLCRVTIPSGGHLASFKDGTGNLGTVLSNSTNQITGHARINPLMIDPTYMFMAMALSSINKKLDAIQETQKEILNYLVQKDKAELKGDIKFLFDVLNNYKHNWDNEKYINNNHIKVLDIRQNVEQKIIFFRQKIETINRKKSFMYSSSDVKKLLTKINSEFKDYQLALYLFAYSSYLEVMLLGNFKQAFLDNVVGKIHEHTAEYTELYNVSYEHIDKIAKSSIQSNMLKGLASASKFMGKTIEKVPLISNSQIDENLIKAGDKLDTFNLEGTKKIMTTMVSQLLENVLPFIENIQIINNLYNNDYQITFDNQNLYLSV